MSKELKSLRKIVKTLNCLFHDPITEDSELGEAIKTIEYALKRLEEQDGVIKTLKEVIAFGNKLPDIEIDEDGDFQGMIGAVGMKIQRQMNNKERELLRNWVLETCFPKELKAIEIIKKKRVNVRAFLKCCNSIDGLVIYNNQCDNKSVMESKELTKEDYDLLKEVLL